MTLETILRDQFVRYPSMQLQDVYKLIYQAALGAEHTIADLEGTRQWLERELAEMGEGPDEPVMESISDDGPMVRVHLRPYVAQGGDPEALLGAFVRTANEYRGRVQTLKNNWSIVAGLGYHSVVEMEAFTQSVQARDYPAVHHSTEYKRLYRPAYRVVWQKFIL
jgi:hypothetical protein